MCFSADPHSDKDRNTEENSVIKNEYGKYIDFSYLISGQYINNIDLFDDRIDNYWDNKEDRLIINT